MVAYVLPRRRSRPTRPPAHPPAHPRPDVAADVLGALDLGTNNCRLLIARPLAEGGFRVIDAFSRIVRLGEGLGAKGKLGEAAMLRTLEALRLCAEKIERRGVTRLRAVATEACRRADNGLEFVARVREATGLALEIISEDEEARLALAGCAPLLDPEVRHALIFDIGGGSTELSWFDLEGQELFGGGSPAPSAWHSVPLGVVTLAEHFGGRDITAELYETMVREVTAALSDFEARHGLGARIAAGDLQLLGTSGTVTTLAGVELGLERYDRRRIDGSTLDVETARHVSRRILAMSHEERVGHPCIGRERADLVVAGCAILEAICRLWPAPRLRVADRGLREGMLLALRAEVRLPAAAPSAPAPSAAFGRPAAE